MLTFTDDQYGRHYYASLPSMYGSTAWFPITAEAAEHLVLLETEQLIKLQTDQCSIHEKEASRMRIEEQLSNLRLKQQEGIEKLKIKKQLATYRIFETADKELYFEMTLPEQNEKAHPEQNATVVKLTNTRELHLTKFFSTDPIPQIEKLTFLGCSEDYVLVGDACSSNGFSNLLSKAGITLSLGRSLAPLATSLMYGHLKALADEEYLPPHCGWTKRGSEWVFTDFGGTTVEKLLNKKGGGYDRR